MVLREQPGDITGSRRTLLPGIKTSPVEVLWRGYFCYGNDLWGVEGLHRHL